MPTDRWRQPSPTSDPIAGARAWVDAAAPVIWLLGKTAAGKTSIIAELTGQAHDDIGQGYAPTTRGMRLYAFPPETPVLRFLDTRGLGDCQRDRNELARELADAQRQAHLVIAVVRLDDLEQAEVLAALHAARRARADLRLIVAQTHLHNLYGRQDRHPEPYPFDGSEADGARPGVPAELGRLLLAQRRLFADLPGRHRPLWVPLDFTRPEMGLAPTDYGAERLWDLLEQTVPDLVTELRAVRDARLETQVRSRIILPWAVAAAAANAVPAPVLGGLGSASLQATMVRQIAGRLGGAGDAGLWREFVGALGGGFLLGFGGRWLATQVLKLGVGAGTALVASWTFAVTWGIGEAALYFFAERAAGRAPDRAQLRQRYAEGLRRARQQRTAPQGRGSR